VIKFIQFHFDSQIRNQQKLLQFLTRLPPLNHPQLLPLLLVHNSLLQNQCLSFPLLQDSHHKDQFFFVEKSFLNILQFFIYLFLRLVILTSFRKTKHTVFIRVQHIDYCRKHKEKIKVNSLFKWICS